LLIYKRTVGLYIATRVAHARCSGHLSRLRIQRNDGFLVAVGQHCCTANWRWLQRVLPDCRRSQSISNKRSIRKGRTRVNYRVLL